MTRQEEIIDTLLFLRGLLDRAEQRFAAHADKSELTEVGRQIESATRVATALIARLEIEHAQLFAQSQKEEIAS